MFTVEIYVKHAKCKITKYKVHRLTERDSRLTYLHIINYNGHKYINTHTRHSPLYKAGTRFSKNLKSNLR